MNNDSMNHQDHINVCVHQLYLEQLIGLLVYFFSYSYCPYVHEFIKIDN